MKIKLLIKRNIKTILLIVLLVILLYVLIMKFRKKEGFNIPGDNKNQWNNWLRKKNAMLFDDFIESQMRDKNVFKKRNDKIKSYANSVRNGINSSSIIVVIPPFLNGTTGKWENNIDVYNNVWRTFDPKGTVYSPTRPTRMLCGEDGVKYKKVRKGETRGMNKLNICDTGLFSIIYIDFNSQPVKPQIGTQQNMLSSGSSLDSKDSDILSNLKNLCSQFTNPISM